MPGKAAAATFYTFYHMFTRRSLHRGDESDVTYDAGAVIGAREGRYGLTGGPIWVHVSGLLRVCNHEQDHPG